jgi:hypothetical protein
MEMCKVKEHLWLKWNPCKPRKILQLVASYVLKPNEFKTFMNSLSFLKVPWNHYDVLEKILWTRNLALWKTMNSMY